MARVVYSRNALANLRRLARFLVDGGDVDSALAAVRAIRTAVDMLQHHPLIGKMIEDDVRELVISYGKTGYIALYRLAARNRVRILAIRHQRELDYPE